MCVLRSEWMEGFVLSVWGGFLLFMFGGLVCFFCFRCGVGYFGNYVFLVLGLCFVVLGEFLCVLKDRLGFFFHW